jgi:hypothetical protein
MDRALSLASMLLLDSLVVAAQNANCVSEKATNALPEKQVTASAWYDLGEELLSLRQSNWNEQPICTGMESQR